LGIRIIPIFATEGRSDLPRGLSLGQHFVVRDPAIGRGSAGMLKRFGSPSLPLLSGSAARHVSACLPGATGPKSDRAVEGNGDGRVRSGRPLGPYALVDVPQTPSPFVSQHNLNHVSKRQFPDKRASGKKKGRSRVGDRAQYIDLEAPSFWVSPGVDANDVAEGTWPIWFHDGWGSMSEACTHQSQVEVQVPSEVYLNRACQLWP